MDHIETGYLKKVWLHFPQTFIVNGEQVSNYTIITEDLTVSLPKWVKQ